MSAGCFGCICAEVQRTWYPGAWGLHKWSDIILLISQLRLRFLLISLSVLQASLDQVSYQVAEEDLFLEFCIVLEGELDVFGLEVTATTQPATADLEGVWRCVSSNTTLF